MTESSVWFCIFLVLSIVVAFIVVFRCRIITRQKFLYKVLYICTFLALGICASPLLFGDLNAPKLSELTEISTCPACYGNTVCDELYSGQISLASSGYLSRYFNAKNVFNGVVVKTNQTVILKKLAHDLELKKFDDYICKIIGKGDNCKPSDLKYLSYVDEKIKLLLQYNISSTSLEPRKGVVLCPYLNRMQDLIHYDSKILGVLNIWTLLNINPEPIILQLLSKSKGWAVPTFGGLCGRLEVVSYEGEPLSSLMHLTWHEKLNIALKIIGAALDFTYKHQKFRFYLMDWSLDNIVANEKGNISFIDLEDVIVLDKHTLPKKDIPNWYQKYNREAMGPGFTFSIKNICQHHLSDHNIWAACYILAGDDKPWLYPIPKEIHQSKPYLDKLLQECLNGENRFDTVIKLQQVVNEILADKDILRNVDI